MTTKTNDIHSCVDVESVRCSVEHAAEMYRQYETNGQRELASLAWVVYQEQLSNYEMLTVLEQHRLRCAAVAP